MAPLLRILVQWLPNLPNTLQVPGNLKGLPPSFNEPDPQQQVLRLAKLGDGNSNAKSSPSRLSSVSWAENRVDVFGLVKNNVTHKWWDGHQWNPDSVKLETLGNGLSTPPVAISWGVDRLDIFGLDDHNVIKHQFWDGTNWQPSVAELENLGGACDPKANIAASTWSQDRLDVFCRGPDGDLLHQYYDGSQWQPSIGSLESLGGSLATGPSVVSWGKNRLDVFAVNTQNQVVHLYWDGSQWSKWETLDNPLSPFLSDPVTVTSWGKDRLDIYALDGTRRLWHLYWDGSQWAEWELLSTTIDSPFLGSVGATSWSANRLDIVGLSADGSRYLYKYYDGDGWRPSVADWYDKGPGYTLSSNPSVISWGQNRLDVFGLNVLDQWVHQAWVGDSWYPGSTDWEILGSQ